MHTHCHVRRATRSVAACCRTPLVLLAVPFLLAIGPLTASAQALISAAPQCNGHFDPYSYRLYPCRVEPVWNSYGPSLAYRCASRRWNGLRLQVA